MHRRTTADVTHPKFFSKEGAQEPTVGGDDAGMGGTTPHEMRRFHATLQAGGLVDAWRLFHPLPDPWADDWRIVEHGAAAVSCPHLAAEGPNYTYRGREGTTRYAPPRNTLPT